MTAPLETQVADTRPSDKELNFRKQEQAFLKKIEEERQARLQLEQKLSEMERQRNSQPYHDDDDDDSDDPYIEKKRFKKSLQKVQDESRHYTETAVQKAVRQALDQERQQTWLKNNPDFSSVMNHAEKLYHVDPELAETILAMPEGFERNKLVYRNIKALGLHEDPKPKIQDIINQPKHGHYQPTSVGNFASQHGADFSKEGQKKAYEKMQALKKALRI